MDLSHRLPNVHSLQGAAYLRQALAKPKLLLVLSSAVSMLMLQYCTQLPIVLKICPHAGERLPFVQYVVSLAIVGAIQEVCKQHIGVKFLCQRLRTGIDVSSGLEYFPCHIEDAHMAIATPCAPQCVFTDVWGGHFGKWLNHIVQL